MTEKSNGFDPSWKMIALIAIVVIALLVISREIINWMAYQDTKQTINNIADKVMERGQSLEVIQKKMVADFDETFAKRQEPMSAPIEEARKQVEKVAQEYKEKHGPEQPLSGREEFKKEADRLMQENIQRDSKLQITPDKSLGQDGSKSNR